MTLYYRKISTNNNLKSMLNCHRKALTENYIKQLNKLVAVQK